jgi:hypothetical protein
MELILIIVGFIINALVLFFVVKSAIRQALLDHYKTVRLYEATGEWAVGPFPSSPPRDLSADAT